MRARSLCLLHAALALALALGSPLCSSAASAFQTGGAGVPPLSRSHLPARPLPRAPTVAVMPGKKKRSSATRSVSSLSGGQTEEKPRPGVLGVLASAWGALGVMYILLNPIKRLLPVALQPFASPGDLSMLHWAAYAVWAVFMGYTEGYKAFQLKFCPMVVARAATLEDRSGGGWWWLRTLLAPAYSMGLFHAQKKRLIVSWSFVAGIATVVAAVKRLPYPWRSIIDGGVVVGLSWGAMSIAALWIRKALTGRLPPVRMQCSHN